MDKVAILVLVLANFGLQSDAAVQIPFNEESLTTSFQLNVICSVINETFVAWLKGETGPKIPQVASMKDVKDEPAVYVAPGDKPGEKLCHLIFPKGSPTSVGGIYTCQGNKNKAKLKIVVRFNLAGLKTSQQLHFGKSGKVVLGALSYPLSTITWKKDNVPVDFSKARLTLEKDGSIVLSKVLESDAGSYVANVNWENRNIVDITIKVSVVEIPVFTVTPKPSKLTGVEGYDYEFCFNASGLPAPTLKWFKSTVEFDITNSRYSVNNNCIGIKTLQKSDIAVYKCEASNSAGKETATVQIEQLGVKPSLVPFTQSVYKKNRHDSFEVLCAGQGTPPPTMEWTKDGKVVSGQTKESAKSTMKISKLRVEDSGNYTCTAKNSLIYEGKELTASLGIQLNVIVKPVVNEQKSDSIVYSFVGNLNNVRVRCDFYGQPKPSVVMTKDGAILASGKEFVEYSFKTSKAKDFGDYICKATNTHGEDNYTVKVVQATAPGKPREVSASKTCNSMTLKWKPPLSDGNMMIIHYVISSLNGSAAQLHKNNVDGSRRSVLVDYKFAPQTSYKVQVLARNAVGAGDPESIDVTTDKYCKPGPPAIYNLGLTGTGPSLLVKWNAPKDNGFDNNLKYRVAWRPKTVKPQEWTTSQELSGTEYQINSLNVGKYEIKVYAINQAGKGNPDVRVVEVKAAEVNDTVSTHNTPSTPYTDNTTSAPVISSTTPPWTTPPSTFFTTQTTPQTKTIAPQTETIAPQSETIAPQTETIAIASEATGTAEMPTLPDHRNASSKEPPVVGKRTGGLSKGAIAGIVIAILLIVLITIDLFCCFFNSCGVIFCCQRACCGKKYEVDGNAKGSEMDKLQKNPPPEQV